IARAESIGGLMSGTLRKFPPALKHGGYSTTTLLPGEDPAEFEKLHERLIVELAPAGVLEEDSVLTIARLLWRKKNLASFRIAAQARKRCDAIVEETRLNDSRRRPKVEELNQKEKAELEAMIRHIRQELGWKREFLDMDEDDATVDRLLKELAVEE